MVKLLSIILILLNILIISGVYSIDFCVSIGLKEVKMKIALINHGCAKNLVDSELMLGLLAQKGHDITLNEDDAQIVIVNTCSFIHDAEKESVQQALILTRASCLNTKTHLPH